MSSADREAILQSFISVTQCSHDEATRYLEAAQWNAQTAMEIFYDDGMSHNDGSTGSRTTPHVQPHAAQGGSGAQALEDYESDDESSVQAAIDESLRSDAARNVVAKDDKTKSTSGSSKFGTLGNIKHNSDSDEEGQAFYAGGSDQSGQQILGPKKPKDTDKKVTKIFEAARALGAKEADEPEESSGTAKREKAFSGVGYTLGDQATPSRSFGQSLTDTTGAAASNRVEQIPLRFFSNGFTVGDGELRKFEQNKEFMNYIKRGEVPPELRALSSGGRQVEVRLEDHRNEEYRAVAPQFKAFGGAGHMLGSPVPTVTQTTTKIDSSAQSSAKSTISNLNDLEKLSEQNLKSSSSSTTIRLRLPDLSSPVRIVIDLNRTLADLRRFLAENVPSLQANQFQFIEPPSTKIKPEDETKTIGEAKLTNATLAIRRG